MPVSQYTLRFSSDGTLATVPTGFAIVPGTDVTFVCRVDETVSGDIRPLDLTDARLFFELVNQTGTTGMYREGAPTFTLTNPKGGIFTITLTADDTAYLTEGQYTWEIKAVLPSGAVKRVGYCAAPIAQSIIPTLR